MAAIEHTVTGEVWLSPGPGGWHFVTLPVDMADDLRARFADAHRPFGSLPVRARIGETAWTTSLFADTKSSSYLLPIEADVRRRAGVADGDTVTVTFVVEA